MSENEKKIYIYLLLEKCYLSNICFLITCVDESAKNSFILCLKNDKFPKKKKGGKGEGNCFKKKKIKNILVSDFQQSPNYLCIW